MASSTHHHHHLSHLHSTTSAPPPTPSAQPTSSSSSSAATADVLSRLLHRLPPPTLSLPTRRSSLPTSPPLISLSASNSGELLFSAASQLGFFQLSDHRISSELADSAVSDSLSLFDLTRDQKDSYFPKKWPLGYENDDEDDDGGEGETFWLDSACSSFECAGVDLASLKSLTRELERVGLEVIEKLLNAAGFKNPGKEDPTRFCSLMWVHREGLTKGDKTVTSSGGFYPYVVCLEYQIRRRKYSLLSDSGWVTVLPRVDSVMVTVGDIAQVWSNGKLKKVRGKPLASMEEVGDQPRNISMSLLVTLPLESIVSPLLPAAIDSCSANENNELEEEKEEEQEKTQEEERLFSSFSFEDYAWRVYHEPFLSKDPIDRYRIQSF